MRHWKLGIVLLITWLMLNNSVHPGDIAMGVILGLVIPALISPLLPTDLRIRRPALLARFILRVLRDIVISNIEVARRVLGPESAIRPAFIWYPLQIQSPYGIAVLAGAITMTPGTVSVDVTEDRRYLLIHALNVSDEQELIASIRHGYEDLLKEIFPC